MNKVTISIGIAIVLIVSFLVVAITSIRPNIQKFKVVDIIEFDDSIDVIGYRTITTMRQSIEVLLDKPGGFISNDISPPFVFMDDMPNWEFGAVAVLRESSIVIRRHFTRSNGAQSMEDKDAVKAQTLVNNDTENWMFPSMEGWWFADKGKLVLAAKRYQMLEDRLLDDDISDGNFYTRATSLADFTDAMNRLFGSLSQRLAAANGRVMMSSTVGDKNATESKPQVENLVIKTSDAQLDDIFWEAQGSAWALDSLLRAIEYDFKDVLKDKNAIPLVHQIRNELRIAQDIMISPIIMNGGGDIFGTYGPFANHSLILANYISRASSLMGDLKRLLENG